MIGLRLRVMNHALRDYNAIALHIAPQQSRESGMRAVVDALWHALSDKGVSWVGFYLDQPQEPDDRRLVLGPCRNKPACSPIGLHGVCGQALTSQHVRIVRDVAALGLNYIACDPRDRSEIVLPLFAVRAEHKSASADACWGVLDVDSWEIGAFDDHDAAGLWRVLVAAGLTAATHVPTSRTMALDS